MTSKLLIMTLTIAAAATLMLVSGRPAGAGETASSYQVLAAIRHGNLTVFPVVAASSHDTHQFLTLDEGLRSGEVIVTESGGLRPLMRRGPGTIPQRGAQVNQLVLVNNSKRPLILLAGEIVTGGKQDRVIGKDRIVPSESDPIDLGVFCVEPGRWTGASAAFDGKAAPMAQPAVRGKAMADKDQGKVWDEVGRARETMRLAVPAPAMAGVTSYAKVMQNADVQQKVDEVAAPIQQNYQSLIAQLRDQHAVGVVVAVNGQIVWADIFASPELLEKYWPKLVRSYASEAIVARPQAENVDGRAAQVFLNDLQGRRQVSETEPGLYRHTETTGDGFKAFELTSLLPKTGFAVHVAKMAE
jgi:sulfur carrier protein ThiS